MTIKFFPNDKGNPPGKLSDAELHFSGGPLDGLKLDEALHMAVAGGVVTSGLESDLPVRNSAMARRSAAVRLLAIVIIEPVSIADSTRSAAIVLKASRLGARFAPVSWHIAQLRL